MNSFQHWATDHAQLHGFTVRPVANWVTLTRHGIETECMSERGVRRTCGTDAPAPTKNPTLPPARPRLSRSALFERIITMSNLADHLREQDAITEAYESAAKFYPCCPQCGSASITCDAVARWDFDTQAWTLSSLQDFLTCDDCGADDFAFVNKPHP